MVVKFKNYRFYGIFKNQWSSLVNAKSRYILTSESISWKMRCLQMPMTYGSDRPCQFCHAKVCSSSCPGKMMQWGHPLSLLAGPGLTQPARTSDTTSFGGMLNLLPVRSGILLSSVSPPLGWTRTGKWAKFWVPEISKVSREKRNKKSTRVSPIDSPCKTTEDTALNSSK